MELKSLNFFDSVPLVNDHCNKLKYVVSEITSYNYNSKFIVFCDTSGFVHVLGRNWKKPLSFQADRKPILKSALSSEHSVLSVITRETQHCTFSIKLFNIDHISSPKYDLNALGSSRLNISSQVSSLEISVSNKNLFLAVGSEKGDLYIYQKALTSSNDIPSSESNFNFRCFRVCQKSIKAVKIMRNKLLICTDTDVLSYLVGETGLEKRNILDTKSTSIECTAVGYLPLNSETYLLVGRNDAVYFFTSEGLGPCYGLGPCGVETIKSVALHKNYLVIVGYKTNRPFSEKPCTYLVILDIHDKLVVFEKYFDNVIGLLSNDCQCYFFTSSNELFALQEYSAQAKVELLLKKGLFEIATRLAHPFFDNEDILTNIYLKHGDYLLSKGFPDAAVEKYIMTLGIVDPYIIIRKFLDPRLNTCLCKYLDALLKSGYAKQQHVKLMLKCNERLDLYKEDTFVQTNGIPKYSLAHLKDKAIKEKSVKDVSYPALIKILKYDSLVQDFFVTMSDKNIYNFFLEHGKQLLETDPYRTVQIIHHICKEKNSLLCSPERFVQLLLKQKSLCKNFIALIDNLGESCKSTIYNVYFELILQSNFSEADSQQILEFLSSHCGKLNDTHILLLCKLYAYTPGIEKLNEFGKTNPANVNLFWENILLTLSSTSDCESSTKTHKQLLTQCTQQERIYEFLLDMRSSRKCLSEILHYLLKSKDITVGQIHGVFKQGFYKNVTLTTNLNRLTHQAKLFNEVVQSYLHKPIEFRSSFCNFCRQEIYLPAVYHLCQHAFHKDCLHSYASTEWCNFCKLSSSESRQIYSSEISQHFEAQYFSKTLPSCDMRFASTNFIGCFLPQNQPISIIPSLFMNKISNNRFDEKID